MNNRLVVKNTLALYVRTIVVVLISLFTTRILLKTLGLSDIGIYNIVGGVLSLIGILNNTMANATQRFIIFDLGVGDIAQLKKTFSTILFSQVSLALLLCLLAETIGLWFVNNKLVIPVERMCDANWVYQIAVLSMVLSVIKSPYTAALIAHEKMSIYAYFSIIDVVIKLAIVFAMLYMQGNKLIIYAVLLLLSNIIDFLITIVYTIRKFDECSLSMSYNKEKIKEIFSFSGWTLMGQTTIIANEQVVNIFINWFFGTIANGACDIARRINSVITQFVFQFQTALTPSIIKNYASGKYDELSRNIFLGCKLSYILMFIFCIPIIIETEVILNVWLGTCPIYTVWFIRLILINTLADSMTGPIQKAIQATGKIKKMQIYVSMALIFVIPFSYILLYYGAPPFAVFIPTIILGIITLFIRLYLLGKYINLNILTFWKGTVYPCLNASFITVVLCLIFSSLLSTNIFAQIFSIFICLFISSIMCYYICLNISEKKTVRSLVCKFLKINNK